MLATVALPYPASRPQRGKPWQRRSFRSIPACRAPGLRAWLRAVMSHVRLGAAWGLVVGGLLTGVVLGLFFHRDDWMGGYGSWRRRMARLGHISFFGTAFLNLLAAVTPTVETRGVYGVLLLAGAVAMPTVCFLSAWRKPFRHAFFIPVLCLTIGSAGFAFSLWHGG